MSMKLPKNKPLTKHTKVIIPREWFINHNENGMLVKLITNMRLLGECLRLTHPTFFTETNYKGVLVNILIPSNSIHPELNKPGDIDMLIIPYTENKIAFSEALAIEAKVIRASYEKQGKSPKKFGFSQAQGLFDIGFPYVAVYHFIVSDISPTHTWKKMLVAKIGENDSITFLGEVLTDRLPCSLIERAIGRLLYNRNNSDIGLCCCYMSQDSYDNEGFFFPSGLVCTKNMTDSNFANYIEEYYRKNWRSFFNILKNNE